MSCDRSGMPPSRSALAGALALCLIVPAIAHARAPRPVRLEFPRTTIPGNTNVEACWVVHVPASAAFEMAQWHVRHRGTGGAVAARHFLVRQYLGDDPPAASVRGTPPVRSRGCLEVDAARPAASDAAVVIAGVRDDAGFLPDGLALSLAPTPARPGAPADTLVFVLSGNWVNASDRARVVSATVELEQAPAGSVLRPVTVTRDTSADGTIVVPPFGTSTASGSWRPPSDACVLEVSGAFHRRGRFLAVDRLDAMGNPANPEPTTPNPLEPGRRHLFGTTDYTDPGSRVFPRGLRVRAGESLAWTCWYENGDLTPVRLGCEATAGVVPGASGAPATPCATTTPASAGCAPVPGTGACVPAAVVGGAPPHDERCALVVAWWEPSAERGCDE